MENLIVRYEDSLEESSEVFARKEPAFLHCMIWITVCLIITAVFIVCFGKADDVVNAGGSVRPVVNVSSVKNITSGEIEKISYKIGQSVKAGDELLRIRPDSVVAEKVNSETQLRNIEDNLYGLKCILRSINSGSGFLMNEENCVDSVRARFRLYCTEMELLKAGVIQANRLYMEENNLPEYSKVKSDVQTAAYNYEKAELALKEYMDSFYNDLNQEIESLKVQKESLKQQLNQIDVMMKNLVIRAPVDGYVFEVSSLNEGDYIFQDQEILNVVPSDEENLKIELNVPASDMGKIKKGQKVKLRFPAFPFYEYNGIDGVIQAVQPDSQSTQSGSLYYVVYASINSAELKNHRNEVFKIKPGLEVDARIVLERDTILHFLLKKLDLWV